MSSKLTPGFSSRSVNTSQGLTLLELLVTLSIASILLFVGMPSLAGILRKNQLETATHDLLTAINTTRTIAVMQQKRAVLKAGTNWQNWELFIDLNDNGFREDDEQLILEQRLSEGLSIQSTKAMRTISFINTGESRQAKGTSGGSFLAGSISICSEKQPKGYKLILARGGRTRISSISCH